MSAKAAEAKGGDGLEKIVTTLVKFVVLIFQVCIYGFKAFPKGSAKHWSFVSLVVIGAA